MITEHGLKMPKLGLGTWRMKGPECVEAVQGALTRGYRHIDTAQMYGNEDAVGEALANTSVPRADIHLTTKVWWENLAPDAMKKAMDNSLSQLRQNYVDLYLIHWPSPTMDLPAALAQMVKFKEQGLARNIGVSNFPVALLKRAVEEIGAPIAVNQFEYHVLIDQRKLVTYARSKGVLVTAYCPLAQGRLADHPSLSAIAAKHGVSSAQVALKWLLDQDGVAAIPKAGRARASKPISTLRNWCLTTPTAPRLPRCRRISASSIRALRPRGIWPLKGYLLRARSDTAPCNVATPKPTNMAPDSRTIQTSFRR